MRSFRLLVGALAAGLLAWACRPAYAFDQYTLVDLGPLGSTYGQGLAINAGRVVSGTYGYTAEFLRAFTWSNGSYSTLPVPGDYSAGYGINSSGTICGYWTDSLAGTEGAFTAQGTNYSLLQPYGALTQAWAYGINDGNTVVGACASRADLSDSIATIWQNGVASIVPGITGQSAALAVNNSGVVVGETAVTGMTGMQPFTEFAGGMNLLPLSDGFYSGGAALAVNSQGSAVGVGYIAGLGHALLWKNGGPIDLGALSFFSDAGDVIAKGINDYDQIVGSDAIKNFEKETVAFIWENGQIVNLNSLVVGNPRLVLHEARGINNSGEIIGTAVSSTGERHAVLLLPVIFMTRFAVSPVSVLAGTGATGTVVINRRASQAGTVIYLASSDPTVASVPPTVTVPAGTTTVDFPITTHNPNVDRSIVITATGANNVLQAPLTVLTTNPHLNGFLIDPSTVFDGQQATGTVSLRLPAPAGGIRVTITNSTPSAAAIPTTVTIPQGQVSKSFTTIGHAPFASAGTTAVATYNGISFTQGLNVHPIVLQSLELAHDDVIGGATVGGVVRIPIRAPSGGYRVTLSSSNTTDATVPASVTIPAGAQSAGFVVASKPVGGTAFVTITASHGSSTLSKQLQVLPPEVSTFRVSTTRIKGGRNVTGTVTLSGKAPTGGVVIHISSNPNLVSPLTNVLVRAGSTSVSFTLQTSVVSATTSVSVTAMAFNVARAAQLTLTP